MVFCVPIRWPQLCKGTESRGFAPEVSQIELVCTAVPKEIIWTLLFVVRYKKKKAQLGSLGKPTNRHWCLPWTLISVQAQNHPQVWAWFSWWGWGWSCGGAPLGGGSQIQLRPCGREGLCCSQSPKERRNYFIFFLIQGEKKGKKKKSKKTPNNNNNLKELFIPCGMVSSSYGSIPACLVPVSCFTGRMK